MKLLLIGSGGREHSLAWKLAKSEKVEKIFVAPGNGGTAIENKCENVDVTDINELLTFAKENNIDLTIVGPEDPLTKGIVDLFKAEGLKIFGPDKAGAELEGSKSYSKDFMKKYGVKTAEYEVFYEADKALAYLENCTYPIVIKADGLAAGKGVSICETREEAKDAIKSTLPLVSSNILSEVLFPYSFLETTWVSIAFASALSNAKIPSLLPITISILHFNLPKSIESIMAWRFDPPPDASTAILSTHLHLQMLHILFHKPFLQVLLKL